LVGASTSTLMEDHAEGFRNLLSQLGISVPDILYGAESVLLPAYRNQGHGHHFFDLREAHARAMGRGHVAFFSVVRPQDHPMRAAHQRSNDSFWLGRGYAPQPGILARFAWRDQGQVVETEQSLQFWLRKL
jgi:hypothetical protein